MITAVLIAIAGAVVIPMIEKILDL